MDFHKFHNLVIVPQVKAQNVCKHCPLEPELIKSYSPSKLEGMYGSHLALH